MNSIIDTIVKASIYDLFELLCMTYLCYSAANFVVRRLVLKYKGMKEIICADAMYQSTAHARGNCAQRFVHLPGGFELPTYAETLASTLYLPVL